MGISYVHTFIVRDLTWRPTKAHAEAIHRVLIAWRLVRDRPELLAGHGKRLRRISGATIARRGSIPDELVMRYSPQVEGEPAGRVVGPLEAGSADDARPFIWLIDVVLGRDYKIIDAPDFGPVSTRLVGRTRPTHTIDTYDVIAAAWEDPPPRTRVKMFDPWRGGPLTPPQGFVGVMRSGVVLDCDRARPAFARTRPGSGVPGGQFVSALEGAFSTELLQVGRYL